MDGKVAMMSELVKTMIGGLDDDVGSSNGSAGSRTQEIPLPNVKTEVLVKVIEYCKHHVGSPVAPIQKPLVDSDMKKVCSLLALFLSSPKPPTPQTAYLLVYIALLLSFVVVFVVSVRLFRSGMPPSLTWNRKHCLN